ncbi:MAG TPA: lytic transglycosylase domain-containing protein [Candidatus Angelobacter sp.]|nr:lytic transglycosylase domain-containing protein [Candidatus Angelobacter sp.]
MRGALPLLIGLILTASATVQQNPDRQAREALMLWASRYAIAYGVPSALVQAVIEEESGWNPYAVSKKGAVGVMQLMPATARRFGVLDRYRGDENIRGGVSYLALLLREFGGDLRLVTAAYYVGEEPIQRRGLDYSSADVHGYVQRVAKRYQGKVLNVTKKRLTTGGEREKAQHAALVVGRIGGQSTDDQHRPAN